MFLRLTFTSSGLDSSVAPKTLTVSTLDALSPSWRIPAPTRSSALSMAMCGAVRPAVAAPVSNAGALAALPRLRVMTRRNSRETTTSNEAPANSASSSNASNSNAQKQETPLTEQSCCICLETFCTGHRVRRLPCRHLFHTTYVLVHSASVHQRLCVAHLNEKNVDMFAHCAYSSQMH